MVGWVERSETHFVQPLMGFAALYPSYVLMTHDGFLSYTEEILAEKIKGK